MWPVSSTDAKQITKNCQNSTKNIEFVICHLSPTATARAPPPASPLPPLCRVGLFAKTEYVVLGIRPFYKKT